MNDPTLAPSIGMGPRLRVITYENETIVLGVSQVPVALVDEALRLMLPPDYDPAGVVIGDYKQGHWPVGEGWSEADKALGQENNRRLDEHIAAYDAAHPDGDYPVNRFLSERGEPR